MSLREQMSLGGGADEPGEGSAWGGDDPLSTYKQDPLSTYRVLCVSNNYIQDVMQGPLSAYKVP